MLRYLNGEPVKVGDLFGPGVDQDAQVCRVVAIIDDGLAAPGYCGEDWLYLERGILVEHTNINGRHLVHYPEITVDMERLSHTGD